MFVFVDVLKAHNVLVVNPLSVEAVNSKYNISVCFATCVCMHAAAEFVQWLHAAILVCVWASRLYVSHIRAAGCFMVRQIG